MVQLVSIAVQCCDVVVGRLRGWRSVGGRMHTVGVADCISWMSFVCSIVFVSVANIPSVLCFSAVTLPDALSGDGRVTIHLLSTYLKVLPRV